MSGEFQRQNVPMERERSSTSGRFSTSGKMTPTILGVFCAGLLVAGYERGHGHLGRLKARVNPQVAPIVGSPGPGGQPPVRLSRTATAIGTQAEFLSVTLLPGRGMNVFQISALVPGRGEVELLASPALADADAVFTGTGADADGAASTTVGGAFLAPWAGRLTGAFVQGALQTTWQDKTVSFPAEAPEQPHSVEGLLLKRGADAVQTSNLYDGQAAEAVFHAGSFDGHWPSTVDLTVRVELTANIVDMTVTARNTGTQPTPFGLGWQPLFAIPARDRAGITLRLPSQQVVDVDRATQRPTGKMDSVAGTALDYAHGAPLAKGPVDATYTGMGASPLAEIDNGPENFSLSIMAMSPSIQGLRLIVPANKPWVSLGPMTNLDDPLGTAWQRTSGGLTVLAPGDSLQWKVRLAISVLGTGQTGHPAAKPAH
jgi:galactose mutarotase-like enzyme